MRTLFNAVVGVVALVALLESIQSAPVLKRKDKAKALAFMMEFGYLNDTSGGAAHPNSTAVKNATRDLQIFGNLTATGELNQETIDLINTKRCGTKDPVKKLGTTHDVFGNLRVGEYYLQGTVWRKKDLTFRFEEPTPDLRINEQKDILRKAIRKWEEASTLNIHEADPTVSRNNVDILIRFVNGSHGDPYRFDGPGGTLAHAFYPHNNKGFSGDAHFDDEERFTTGRSDGINLDWVAVHEFGHSLGLEHSNVRESIMYPWYKGYIENIELTNDDILGIQALYGKRKPITKKSTPPTNPTDPATRSTKPIPTDPPTPGTKPIPTDPPTVHPACKPGSRYDAVVIEKNIHGKKVTHFIQGDYFWTADERLRTKSEPKKVRDYWPNVRTPVDAAYRNKQGNVVFFSGNRFWEYNNRRQLTNRRRGTLRQYGLTVSLTNMDTVFTWKKNEKTYFFKDTKYWRYDENKRSLDAGYPINIRDGWPDLPRDIDAAVTWRNDRSYIFSGDDYLKLSNRASGRQVKKASNRYPRKIVGPWMKCEDVGAIAVGGLRLDP